MQATEFEFRNRGWIITAIFWAGFVCYFFDRHNAAFALLQAMLGRGLALDSARGLRALRILLSIAALTSVLAAALRTWATAYLQSQVVFARDLRDENLVADGPYRHVRNPLYLGGLLLAISMGTLASRVGFFVMVVGLALFYARLVLREEEKLAASQGSRYRAFCSAVPRFWPALWPRLPASGAKAQWWQAFLGEGFMWAFAAGMIYFAARLEIKGFYILIGAGLLAGFLIRRLAKRKVAAARTT